MIKKIVWRARDEDALGIGAYREKATGFILCSWCGDEFPNPILDIRGHYLEEHKEVFALLYMHKPKAYWMLYTWEDNISSHKVLLRG